MNQQQLLQKPKLADRNIGTPGRLKTLDARDTDTDVRGLDHADVVRAVADSE